LTRKKRSGNSLLQEKAMYEFVQNLSLSAVEQALECLYESRPPESPELKELSPVEWFLLSKLLKDLLQEREQAILH